MRLMRSTSVSLVLMSSPAYVRQAGAPTASLPSPVSPAPAEAGNRNAAIARGGFGQLGDGVTACEPARRDAAA